MGVVVLARRQRVMLQVMAVSALMVALSLASAEAASAQTPFQASVKHTGPAPAGCPPTAYVCGTANLAGYGAASWTMFVGIPTIGFGACGSSNTATTYFTLASDLGSTLVLDENLTLCGLGNDGAAWRGYFANGPKAAGHPFAIVGGWTVDPTSSGQFGQFVGKGGFGTDLINLAGFQAIGSYSGTLG